MGALLSCLVTFLSSASDAGTQAEAPLITARPYRLVTPADTVNRLPLVVLLHGYDSEGANIDRGLGFSELAQKRGVLLAIPDAAKNAQGIRAWKATDVCCHTDDATLDDVAYLTELVRDVRRRHRVDEKRIFFVGRSNGGFMAHRMACDAGDWIAGIVSISGAGWKDPTKCRPSRGGAAILQVHGTADSAIEYAGGDLEGVAYPGAVETVGRWAARSGCSAALTKVGPPLDLVDSLPGAETRREGSARCARAIELWTVEGADHEMAFAPRGTAAVLDFLLAHPRR